MIIKREASSSTDKSIRANVVGRINDINNIVNSNNKTLVIILAVTLPTLAFITILTSIIICYRRRHTTIWLKKSDNSNRLQAIIVNLSPTSIQTPYSGKNLCLSHPQFQQPHTKTIVYNRLSAPSSPIVYTPFKLPIQGETNTAFDEHSLKNDEQPILRTSSIMEQPATTTTTTTLQTDFPVSLQAPVPTITSTFVKAIAAHRLTLFNDINNTLSETSTLTNTNITSSRHSGTSPPDSNTSQTVLLFSQRTEF